MSVLSDFMNYKLKDMSDFQDLKMNKFEKNIQKFNLKKCIKDIQEMMEVKAS
jgi:hypothetical protein